MVDLLCMIPYAYILKNFDDFSFYDKISYILISFYMSYCDSYLPILIANSK